MQLPMTGDVERRHYDVITVLLLACSVCVCSLVTVHFMRDIIRKEITFVFSDSLILVVLQKKRAHRLGLGNDFLTDLKI